MTNTRETTIIGKLIKDQTDRTHIQFFRYLFVGGAAFIVQFISFIVFTDILSDNYLISAPIAFILGLIANYALSINWVFNKRTLDNKWSEFTIFAVIGVIGLILNELFIWFFADYVGFYHLFYNVHLFYNLGHNVGLYISNIVTAALILFWNFFARKFTLFK